MERLGNRLAETRSFHSGQELGSTRRELRRFQHPAARFAIPLPLVPRATEPLRSGKPTKQLDGVANDDAPQENPEIGNHRLKLQSGFQGFSYVSRPDAG